MAARVVCECCGKVVSNVKDAVHIRVHRLSGAETFFNATVAYFDVCKECYKKIEAMMKNKDDDK